MAAWGGLTNSWEKKRSKRQRRKGKIFPFECRVPKNSKERYSSLPQWSVQRNRGNNTMGKTRDLFKKIGNTKGIFHAKMSTIKDRNGMDLTEEDSKKRWQEYTEELYKKDLHDPDNHDGVITYLEPDILECEAKRALGSITTNKASGCDGILVELFQILKDDLWKCCTQYASKFGKLRSGHRTGKGHFSFQSQRKAMPKNVHTTTQLHSSHTLAK